MAFLLPLWLLALIPWAGVALWLLIGRNPRVAVPFIQLWNDSDAPKRRASHALRRPPAAMICALLATLLALVAAAKPALVRDQSVTPQIAPKIPENVGIVRVAVRETPRPAVMVRLRNQSDLVKANLQVTTSLAAETASPAVSVTRDVELPARNGERDYFFDLVRLQDIVSVELVVDDELKTDNRAQLFRERSPAKLEPRTTVSPELTRMIDVYSKNRPVSAASNRVAIVDDAGRLSADEAGVVVAGGGDRFSAQAPLRVSEHPITAHVRDWNAILTDALIGRVTGDGWTPVVQAGDHVVVAVRDQPARQVWIGFASPAFARSADFVILWTDVFDWLGGRTEFRLDPSSTLDVKLAKPSPATNESRPANRMVDLSRPMLLAALGFLATAAMLWNAADLSKRGHSSQNQAQSVPSKPLA